MDQEISLREIIETVLKGKWIIIIVTLSALLISGITSFFIISPTYETTSLVRVQQNSSEEDKIQLDLNSYVDSLTSDVAITQLIEKLQLDPNTYSIDSIRSQIQLEAIKDTNVMRIIVKGEEPLLITNISNLLAYELGNRIEIADHSQNIVNLQKSIKELMDKIVVAKSELAEAQLQLKSIPEKQVTKQTVTEDALLQSILKESTNASISDIAGLQMESEEINPSYNLLQTKIAEITIGLTSLQTDEQTLRTRLQESYDRINELDQLMQQDKLSAKTSDRLLSGNQAVFINPAIQPTEPVGPNKLLYMIIAVLVGGMISILFVFLRQYMRNTSKPLTRPGE